MHRCPHTLTRLMQNTTDLTLRIPGDSLSPGSVPPSHPCSPLWLPPWHLYRAPTFTHRVMKELSSAIRRGAHLINYPYSSTEMDVVLRLNIACLHREDLDCNVTSIASSVANLTHRFSLKALIPRFGWWCEQFGLLNKSWFLSHASVVWEHVAERLWHCSIESDLLSCVCSCGSFIRHHEEGCKCTL